MKIDTILPFMFGVLELLLMIATAILGIGHLF